MDKVKELMRAGLTAPQAIKAALGAPVAQIADRYEIPRPTLANHLNANVVASDQTIAALVAELGGTENEWRELLWQAMRPAHLAVS